EVSECGRRVALALRLSSGANVRGSGRHSAASSFSRERDPARVCECRAGRANRKARNLPFASPFLRDAPVGERLGHSDSATVAWSYRHSNDDDLHACVEPWWAGGTEPGGSALNARFCANDEVVALRARSPSCREFSRARLRASG